jgi:hypothetical protein
MFNAQFSAKENPGVMRTGVKRYCYERKKFSKIVSLGWFNGQWLCFSVFVLSKRYWIFKRGFDFQIRFRLIGRKRES